MSVSKKRFIKENLSQVKSLFFWFWLFIIFVFRCCLFFVVAKYNNVDWWFFGKFGFFIHVVQSVIVFKFWFLFEYFPKQFIIQNAFDCCWSLENTIRKCELDTSMVGLQGTEGTGRFPMWMDKTGKCSKQTRYAEIIECMWWWEEFSVECNHYKKCSGTELKGMWPLILDLQSIQTVLPAVHEWLWGTVQVLASWKSKCLASRW